MKNDLVKVHKDFTRLTIGELKEKELELFYYICMNVSEKEDEIISIDFSNIKKSLGSIKSKQLQEYIIGLQKRMASLRIRIVEEKRIATINLFDMLENDLVHDILKIRVTKSSLYFFNGAKPYLRFLFSDIRKLNGKYAKLLVPYLMEESHKKKAEFEREHLFSILEVEDKYKARLNNFNDRILKPAVEELNRIFINLKYKPNKDGRTIIGYTFTWDNEFNFQKPRKLSDDREIKKAETIEICEIEQYWLDNFPGVNYTLKHKKIIDKLKKNNSIAYIKNYLQEQWDFVKNNAAIENRPAYFSQLILEEKAVFKDYEALNKKEDIDPEEDKIQAENFVGTLFENIGNNIINQDEEIKENIEIEQPALFLTEITQEEYDFLYQKYLESHELKDEKTQKIIFSAMNKNKYKIVEKIEAKKVYTVDDIPEEKLLSKNGKKLVGAALQMKINKILEEMNK